MNPPDTTDRLDGTGSMARATALVVWEQIGQRIEPYQVVVDHRDRAVLLTAAVAAPRGLVRAAQVVAAPRWGGLPSKTPRPAPGAFSDESHIVKADRDRGRLAREARALEVAAEIGVPVPNLRFSALDATPPVLIMSVVPGLELASESGPADWAAVGAVLRRWHDAAPADRFAPFWPEARDWALAYLDDPAPAARLTARVRARLGRLVDRVPVTPRRTVALHGDCAAYHWFLDDGVVTGVIDFGDVGTGDPVWDLATLTLFDHERLDDVLDGYDADAAVRADVEATLWPHRVLRHLGAVAWLLSHDVDPEPTYVELERIAADHA